MMYSKFGNKFTRPNGITQLMDDLGKANSRNSTDMVMLGGGNPAIIPDANAVFVEELKRISNTLDINAMLGLYDGPQGNDAFREALADLLHSHYGWELSADNISLSNGSQSNFFSLFNLLAGEMEDGSQQKILFPLVPFYRQA